MLINYHLFQFCFQALYQSQLVLFKLVPNWLKTVWKLIIRYINYAGTFVSDASKSQDTASHRNIPLYSYSTLFGGHSQLYQGQWALGLTVRVQVVGEHFVQALEDDAPELAVLDTVDDEVGGAVEDNEKVRDGHSNVHEVSPDICIGFCNQLELKYLNTHYIDIFHI